MRILMITDFYWPFLGGVEQHVRRLSHGLVKREHEVAVVTLKNEQLAEFEYDEQVRVYRLQGSLQHIPWLFSHQERPWAPPFPDPGVMKALKQVLLLESPDIVHGHDWLARSFVPLKAPSGPRFVVSLHYYTLSCAKKNLMFMGKEQCSGPGFAKCLRCASHHYGPGKGIPVTLTNWWMGDRENRAVDMFLPVSQATAAGNGLVESKRVQVVPNFMGDDRPLISDSQAYLSQLPITGFLLFVGDLRRDKGINQLLAAYAGLEDAPPLVLIGKVWSETPQEFPPNVFMLKNWPNDAVLAAWERCTMAIVPSLWPEPFGIVVIEAMAAGRPVIASRVGGIPEIIKDGETGLLVPPGDTDALRQAIARLLADPVLRARMGAAAQQQAAAYQASAVVPRIERIYGELLYQQPEAYEPAPSGEHSYQQP